MDENRTVKKISSGKKMKFINKTSVPDNIVIKNNKMLVECKEIEHRLPSCLVDFFLYLKNAVAISTRLAYLRDIEFFFLYMQEHILQQRVDTVACITIDDINSITSKDINYYIGEHCNQYINHQGYIIENNAKTLARKRSSLSVLFQFMYRDQLLSQDITGGFNPIRVPKKHPDSIKRLEIEEVSKLLEIVVTGDGLSNKEKQYWKKTKLRDQAILVMFITYGLRVSELQQLDLGSIHFSRQEFKIFRKRSKESTMPLNDSTTKVLKEYIEFERPQSLENDDALFLSLQGKRLTVRAIRTLVQKYTSIAMDVPRNEGYSPHKLRATAATSLIEYGFSIYDVQNLLDHENVTTTQLYSAHRKNSKRNLIEQYELLEETKKEK